MMKTVIILGDGMSDHPVASLGGKTPLMVARKPYMDRIAREGVTGLFTSIPEGMVYGSDVANLSVLGYDPRTCLQGRGVLEAASMGVDLDPADVAMRRRAAYRVWVRTAICAGTETGVHPMNGFSIGVSGANGTKVRGVQGRVVLPIEDASRSPGARE